MRRIVAPVVMSTIAALGAAAAAIPVAAAQQEITIRSGPSANDRRGDEVVRVQVGVNVFLPGDTREGPEGDKLRERARRMLYEMAAKECSVVEEVLAKSCRLESININVNVNRQQYGAGVTEGVNANGNFALRVTLK